MVFDGNLSETVSLPRVLDCFVESGEGWGTILPFLSMHRDRLADILRYSFAAPRLLSPDMARSLDAVQAETLNALVGGLIKHVDEVGHFYWQMYIDRSAGASLKGAFGGALSAMADVQPYRGRVGGECLRVERPLLEAKSASEMADCMDAVATSALPKYVRMMEHRGVMGPRIMQDDVFLAMSPATQFIILNTLSGVGAVVGLSRPVVKGLKCIAESGGDPEMRRLACEVLASDGGVLADWDERTVKQLSDLKSFNSAVMRLEISGEDRKCDWLLLGMLMKYGMDFVRSGVDAHRELFDEYFQIADVLEGA